MVNGKEHRYRRLFHLPFSIFHCGGALFLAAAALAAQPNPYRTIEGWAKMPEGRTWGATSAVDIAPDGTSIWVAERCGANSCLNSDLPVVLKFDANGTLVTSFGRGLMIFPHGIHVDRDGNIWVTDGQDNKPRRARGAAPDSPLPAAPATPIGHQVFKFSPDGKLLMTLGVAGGGTGRDGFFQPNDVVTDQNGDIYVAEGHGGDNARIVVFDKSGKYLREFGKKGAGPSEFDQPHGLAFDSKGRLFVADRSNNRIQILDKSGKFLEEWDQFSRPSGIFIDRNDMIYVADSESGSVGSARSRTDWKRGIRIGSLKDGKVIALIPDPEEKPPSTSSAEGVAVDAAGNIYGAEVGQRALKKYVKADK
jgi:DNA-binding beta-propeller fold protein YncE